MAGSGFYTAAEAARLTGVPLSTLNDWARKGVLTPSQRAARPRLYSFEDLRDLKVAQELRAQGARPGEVRAVVEFLRVLSGRRLDRLASAEVEVVGDRVVYRNRELGIEPVQPSKAGHRLLAVTMAKIFQDLGGRADATVRELRPARQILIDPDVRGGTPVIDGTRIPTALIAEMVADGMSADEIVTAYPALSHEDVTAAVDWERSGHRLAQ